MDMMEKVESLREKAGVSYTEAKAALEQTGGDLLEALCWLEQHGKTQMVGASCSTQDREPPQEEPQPETHGPQEGAFRQGCRSLWQGIVALIRKGNQNQLVMTSREGRREFSLPVTLFVILLIACFWLVLILMVVALFFGNSFSFEGPELDKDEINDAMGKATDFAENIKQDFTEKL